MTDHILSLEHTYTQLPEYFYQKKAPEKVLNPELVLWNRELALELGIDTGALTGKEGVEILAGNRIPAGAEPIAQAYAGHQFGYFTKLGDGRVVLLGELRKKDGKLTDFQIKGAGRTAYSRGGDGKAALGPMLREYIISEAMHSLRIPTTRSLAVLTTGELIRRDTLLPGAVLVRVASSHIRVGTFQYASQFGDEEGLKALADYTIKRHEKEELSYLEFLSSVIKKQAQLIAQWQLIGFVHGVMNTDNMAISGETIDYGPCAFMDEYNPEIVFSSIDTEGRYAYKNQPVMASWDLARFAETLLPLLHPERKKAIEMAQEEVSKFGSIYLKYYYSGMRHKLGFFGTHEMDKDLIDSLLSLMNQYHVDYTNTFRDLTTGNYIGMELAKTKEFEEWLQLWHMRRQKQSESYAESEKLMQQNNPTVIPRNEWVEDALTAAEEGQDYSKVKELLERLKEPYDYTNQNNLSAIAPKKCGRYITFCGT